MHRWIVYRELAQPTIYRLNSDCFNTSDKLFINYVLFLSFDKNQTAYTRRHCPIVALRQHICVFSLFDPRDL